QVSRLLDLIVRCLYSHKSNASDSLDKLRFLNVTEPALLGDGGELEIRIKPDPDSHHNIIREFSFSFSVDDTDSLGTIAQSGTSKFLKALKEKKDLGADNG
ncbi:hypothetical protein EUTSA_v10003073mg, partial [Eutrema salsugineum]